MSEHKLVVSQKILLASNVEAVVMVDGRAIDLGVISSPYADRLRNWAWKKFIGSPRNRKKLGRQHWKRWVSAEEGMASVFTHKGKNWVADKIRATGGGAVGIVSASPADTPNKIGWGTGAGTAAVTDTTLFSESADPAARATATLSGVTTTQTGDTFRAVGTLTSTTTQTIKNAGLFDAASGGNLVLKGDHADLNLLNTDSVQYTFNLQLT